MRACVQAVQMQGYLLSMLGSGGALYELYSAVLAEPDITAEEREDYRVLQAAADTLPGLCEPWDATHKPSCGAQVSVCLVLACKLSSVWTVAWQHFRSRQHHNSRKE